MRLPVVFGQAAEAAIAEAEKIRPDVILCIGQAGGRDAITPEYVGINLRNADLADNAGSCPKDEAVVSDGPTAYFSSLPVRETVEAIKAAGLPARISYSAGAYVCNDLFYTLLHRYDGSGVRVGFIHIPYSREQGKEPSMELDCIVRALTVAIGAIDG